MNGRKRWIGAAIVVAAAAAIVAWWLVREPTTTVVVTSTPAPAPAVGTRGAAPAPRVRTETPAAVAEAGAAPAEFESKPMLARFRVTSSAGGAPIAGARLELKDVTEEGELVSLVTGSDGTARMTQAQEWFSFRVVVRAKGFVLSRWEFGSTACEDDIALQLDPGTDVAGRVIDDASGDPIAGAQIEVVGAENVSDESGHDVRVVIGRVTTDAAGGFLVVDFPVPSHGAIARVRAARHMGAEFTCDTISAGPLVVRLEPAGCVRGVVRGPDGKPVAGATVSASQSEHVDGDGWGVSAETDDDGAFVLDGLRLGVGYELSALAMDFARATPVDPVVTSPSAREVVRDFVLRRPASLTVVVLVPDGTAAAAAKVTVCRPGSHEYESPVDAGPDGAVFDCIEPGAVVVHAWSDGWAETTADFTLADGETKRITLPLHADFATEGVVVDDAGNPIADATVEASDDFGCGQQEGASATSGADGSFRLRTRSGAERRISVRASGHREAKVNAAPGATGVRVVLLRQAAVSFRLLPAGGDSGRWVYYDAVDDHGDVIAEDSTSHRDGDDGWTLYVPLVTRQLRLSITGYVETVLAVQPVPGETTDLGDVTLDRGAGVVGRVVAGDGGALEDTAVAVYGADGETELANPYFDPDGTFDAHGLDPGKVVVRVRAAGYLDSIVAGEARADPTPVTITLRHGCLLSVRVVEPDGLAALKVTVDALAADGAAAPDGFWMPKAGTYEQRVPPGKWRLVATRGDLRAEETVDVAEGTTREVSLRLAR